MTTPLVFFVNIGLVLSLVIVMLLILRFGALYNYYYGLDEIQGKYKKWIILLLLFTLLVSLSATIFNILAQYLGW